MYIYIYIYIYIYNINVEEILAGLLVYGGN